MKSVTKVICFLSLLCLMGCQQDTTNSDMIDNGLNNQNDAKKLLKINDSKDGVVVDDLLDSMEMLGKTASEIGIPKEIIKTESKSFITTYLDGYIFGTKDYGILNFENLNKKSDDYLAKSVWIHIKELNYEESNKQLRERFGEPVEDGQNPYVKSGEGAVEWSIYRSNDIEIRLFSASERDYVEMSITKINN